MDMSLSKLRETVKDKEAWLQFMGSQRVGLDTVMNNNNKGREQWFSVSAS